MKIRKITAIVLSLLLLLISPLHAYAATDSTRITLVKDSSHSAMDACATDGNYIYVLKHKNNTHNWALYSYTKAGVLVDKKSYTATSMTHPNGLTYYNGYLYIATIQNYVIRVKVNSSGTISSTAKRCSISFENSGITTVGAITYVSENKFIIRGRGQVFAVYRLIEDSDTPRFELKNKIVIKDDDIGASFSTTQDIFYYKKRLYVITWNRIRGNRIAMYSYNETSKKWEYNDVIRISGGTDPNIFEMEGGCVIGGYLYYVTNDQNGDSIYKYNIKL